MQPIRRFEWDRSKAAYNRRKHGVEFSEAVTVFHDPLTVTIPDTAHSEEEDRFVTIGRSLRNRPLIVIHTERDDCIRIISARKATTRERKSHEQSIKNLKP